VKLGRLDAWNEERRARAAAYLEALADLDRFDAPRVQEWAEPVWHLFALGTDERDACRAQLAAAGIETGVHYPVLPHLSAPYLGDGGDAAARGRFPVAERLSARELTLPLYPNMGDEAVAATLAALRSAS
jgi:dTDP-3-amino-3,4,6-trideoxy-alpha-D-glucose transaminase